MKNLTDISWKWKICLNLDQHQTSDNDVCNVVMMPWHYQLPPEVPHYRDPSLVTGCHPGTWDQYWPLRTVSFRHLSVESWAEVWGDDARAWGRCGPGHHTQTPHHHASMSAEARNYHFTTQYRIKSKHEAPGCENLNKRHNYSVFPAKNSPAPVHCHFPLALESWPQSLRNTFLIILGKFMTFCKESED